MKTVFLILYASSGAYDEGVTKNISRAFGKLMRRLGSPGWFVIFGFVRSSYCRVNIVFHFFFFFF